MSWHFSIVLWDFTNSSVSFRTWLHVIVSTVIHSCSIECFPHLRELIKCIVLNCITLRQPYWRPQIIGGHVGVPGQFSWSWDLFCCKQFLCSSKFAAGHMIETLWTSFSFPRAWLEFMTSLTTRLNQATKMKTKKRRKRKMKRVSYFSNLPAPRVSEPVSLLCKMPVVSHAHRVVSR